MQFLDTKLKNIKMVVFDLDGTIADTNKLIITTFEKILKVNKKIIIKNMGPPSKKMIKNIFQKINEKNINFLNNCWEQEYKKRLCKENLLNQNTISTLKYLRKKYILGIITSSSRKIAILTLKENYFLFDFVICSEDYVEHKPNPKVLLKIIKKKNINKENAVYIGDNIIDIKFGKNAKIKTIGKVDILYSKSKLKKENPDYIIKKIEDLKCLL